MRITYKSRREIDLMHHAGQVLVRIFERVQPLVRPGISTKELDRRVHEWMIEEDCVPSFLGYRGFPAVICTSINAEVVHGIPDESRVLREGDLLTVDVGVIWKGYHADAARTYAVGAIDDEALRLMDATARSLDAGIARISIGARLWEVGAAVQEYAESRGYSVVKDFVGHGIGRELHEEPQVPNYVDDGMRRRLGSIRKGLVIAVEPMLNVGGDRVEVQDDGWTVVTKDGRLSAHFEDTVAVTEEGPWILTRPAG